MIKKDKFIELRARGNSYDKISKSLGVSKGLSYCGRVNLKLKW